LTSVTIQCPDEVLLSLKEDASSFGRDLALAGAMKFYELGRLSSGRAAELAGLPRVEFLRRASEFKVPAWDLTADELREDARMPETRVVISAKQRGLIPVLEPWIIKYGVPGIPKESGADAFQIKSLACDRFVRLIGKLSDLELEKIAQAIAMCVGAP